MANICRQAKELLDNKKGSDMTDEERALVSQAIAPLLIMPTFNDITIAEGLEVLARFIDERRGGQ